jgi:predicted ATPase
LSDVFISYARADATTAQAVAGAFEQEGIKVWSDAAIRAGETWDLKIETALKAAKAVVVLWSEHAVASRWVRAEATLADRRRTLIPAQVGHCEIPLPFELLQTADLIGWRGGPDHGGWRRLLADVRLLVDAPDKPIVEGLDDSSGPRTHRAGVAQRSRRRPTNLPVRLPPLLGRDSDLAALAASLSEHRLTTILGTGGLGKSRLAEAAAAARVGDHADGVWWIDLAPLKEASHIASSMARVIGLSAGLDGDELAAELTDRDVLVVLDNCEHLVAGVAELVERILTQAPDVRLLATSQEPLKVAEEHLYRLQPLSVAEQLPHDLKAGGALALFEARASAAESGFRLTADNAALVAEICRKLDGLPLSIELAAARLPLLGLQGILDRLNDRFRLLSSNRRGAPERQQTLRAALEWSVSLLSPLEQRVFARLGVFAGAFDLDAAEWIVPDSLSEKPHVLEHLSTLSDKSLLTLDAGERRRFRLLESPRAFARELLDADEGAGRIHRRHAEYMRYVIDSALESKWTDDRAGAGTRAVQFLDDIRAAVTWAGSPSGDAGILIGLAASGAAIARDIGNQSEAHEWCESAVRRIEPSTPPLEEAGLLHAYAQLSNQQDAEKELMALERAARLCRAANSGRELFEVLGSLAKKHVWRRDFAAAELALSEAEGLLDRAWPPAIRAPLLQARTYMLELRGDAAAGEPLMHELVAIMRTTNNPERLDFALLELAESYVVQGKLLEAVGVHRDVRDRRAHRGAPPSALNWGNLMAVLAQLGEIDEAQATARIAIPLLRKARRLSSFVDHFALLALRLGRAKSAAQLAGRSDASIAASGFDREASEERARRLVTDGLANALSEAETARLMSVGATMTDEAVIAAADLE